MDAIWPAISIGVEIQLQDGAIKEFNGVFLGAFEYLCDLDFLNYACKSISIIEVLFQSSL